MPLQGDAEQELPDILPVNFVHSIQVGDDEDSRYRDVLLQTVPSTTFSVSGWVERQERSIFMPLSATG